MTNILNFQERGQADNWRRQSFCYAMDEVKDLRAALDAKEAEVLALHRDLAGERLRADQGWSRYESANSDRNQLRMEKLA